MPKTWYKVVLGALGVFLGALLIGFIIIIFSEYFPEDREDVVIDGTGAKTIKEGDALNIITYNLGYLSLDNTQDFFMDGGKGVRPKTATNVTKNLAAVKTFIENQNNDIFLFQEVDKKAKRSYNINEYEGLKQDFDGTAAYAAMFNSLYIPYPIFNPIGHVESGVATLSKFGITQGTRIALPSHSSWPKRAVMYKNPILETRIPVEGSSKELVVYNVHLDAYGAKGENSDQLQILLDNMTAEYAKGNYAIAGGDFNQTFPQTDLEQFPLNDSKNFYPTQLSQEQLPDGWKFVTDATKPTSRLLNEVYSGNYDNTQLYVIDGFLLSPNIESKSVITIENGFSYSDHHPVKIRIELKK